jgi:hypothetical protein
MHHCYKDKSAHGFYENSSCVNSQLIETRKYTLGETSTSSTLNQMAHGYQCSIQGEGNCRGLLKGTIPASSCRNWGKSCRRLLEQPVSVPRNEKKKISATKLASYMNLFLAFGNSDCVASSERIISEWWNWKERRRAPSWPDLTCYPGICLETEKKNTKHFNQDSRCLGRDSNPVPPLYKSKALPSEPTYSAIPVLNGN